MGLFKKKTKQAVSQVPHKTHDELTGVLSLPEFYKEAADFILHNPGMSYAFCRASIGNIRSINESYGMVSGDKILKQAAEVIASDESINALVARDRSKFVFMFPYQEQSELNEWIASIHEKLGGIGNVLEQNPKVFMHMGLFTTDGRLVDMSAEEMVACAKIAESEASKRTHASVVRYTDQLRIAAQEDEILMRDAAEALAQKQFAAALQPVLDNEGNLISAKLLTKWNHPQLGAVGAWRFVPLFVKSGFILDLDLYLLEQICALMNKWESSGMTPVRISLNMPRALVSSERSINQCIELKKKYSVADGMIELEFSERLIEDSMSVIPKVFDTLRKNGFVISIEKFGSGMGLTQTITDLKPDNVSFSRGLFENDSLTDDDISVIKNAVEAARQAGAQTFASGVPEQMVDSLRDIGVDTIRTAADEFTLSIPNFEAEYIVQTK